MSRTRRLNPEAYWDPEKTPVRKKDGKPFHKPDKIWKEIRKKKRKAEAKDALRHGRDPESQPHSDTWDYC